MEQLNKEPEPNQVDPVFVFRTNSNNPGQVTAFPAIHLSRYEISPVVWCSGQWDSYWAGAMTTQILIGDCIEQMRSNKLLTRPAPCGIITKKTQEEGHKMAVDKKYMIGNKFAVGSGPNKTSFKKGAIPWNKGIAGLRLSEKSEFKKGMAPINKLNIGSITTRRRKRDGYKPRVFIKIGEPKVWIEYSKYIWAKWYGNILKGDIIHHMDGDGANNNINNLIALPRKDHPVFHSQWGLTPLTMEQVYFYCSRYEPGI